VEKVGCAKQIFGPSRVRWGEKRIRVELNIICGEEGAFWRAAINAQLGLKKIVERKKNQRLRWMPKGMKPSRGPMAQDIIERSFVGDDYFVLPREGAKG